MLAGEQAPTKSDAAPKNDDGKSASGNSSTAADTSADNRANQTDGPKAGDTDNQAGSQQTAQKQDAGKPDDADQASTSGAAPPANDNSTPVPIDAAMIQMAMAAAVMPTPVQPPSPSSSSSGAGQQTTDPIQETADGTPPAATARGTSAGPQTPALQPPLLPPAPSQPTSSQQAAAQQADNGADADTVPADASPDETASAQAAAVSQPVVPASGNVPADIAANMQGPAAAPSFVASANAKPPAVKGQTKDGDKGSNSDSDGTTDASSATLNPAQPAAPPTVQPPAPPPVASPVAQTNAVSSVATVPIAGASSAAPNADGRAAPNPPVPAAVQNTRSAQTAVDGADPVQPEADKNSVTTFGVASATPSHGDKIGSAKDASQGSQGPNNAGDAQQPATVPAPAPAPAPVQPAAPNADQLASGVIATPHTANTSAPAPAAVNVTVNVHVAPQDQMPAPNVNSLAVEIAAKSQSGAKQFDIRLDPPELGRIEVRLSIDATGKAQAHMTVDQPQTLDLMQKDSSSLTRALRDAGLDVSQNGLNFSLKGQDRNSDGGSGNAQPRTPSLTLAATRSIDAVQSSSSYLSSAGDARLDIHV